MNTMKVRDVVFKSHEYLYSGASRYVTAIVVSVNPFVLISYNGDMMWKKENPKRFNILKVAEEDSWLNALERYNREFEELIERE